MDNKFPVKIVGEWWDKYDKYDRINLQKPVAFEQSLDMIAKSRILADSSPFLKWVYMTGFMQEWLITL